MKKILSLALVCLLLLTATSSFASCRKVTALPENTVYLDIENYGTVVIELYPDVAPSTVKNFKMLVNDGFYDGLSFHWVMKDFVIQCGDPTGTGYYGSGLPIYGEFSANGKTNSLSHGKGVVSMARNGSNYNSATSQFFICTSDSSASALDGLYAAFGKVVQGMDIVEKIGNVETDGNQKPLTEVKITKARMGDNLSPVFYNPIEETKNLPDKVRISVESFGDMELELYPEKAPLSVANFKKLVSEGFYDGLTFHRIIEGFMIQGGDPAGNGTGGSPDTVKGEFSINGVNNDLPHEKGVVSMARSSYNNSGSSQFFICQGEKDRISYLDGQYAAFGKLTSGYDVLDRIAALPTDENDAPLTRVVITSVSFLND